MGCHLSTGIKKQLDENTHTSIESTSTDGGVEQFNGELDPEGYCTGHGYGGLLATIDEEKEMTSFRIDIHQVASLLQRYPSSRRITTNRMPAYDRYL